MKSVNAVFTPQVGMICQYKTSYSDDWVDCEIIALGQYFGIVKVLGVMEVVLEFSKISFRPIPKEPTMKEIMLDKWRRQDLGFAYDDLDEGYSLNAMFNFMLKHFDVKQKEN